VGAALDDRYRAGGETCRAFGAPLGLKEIPGRHRRSHRYRGPYTMSIASMNLSLLERLLAAARDLGASDLLLEAGTPVVVRVKGELHVIGPAIGNAALTDELHTLIGEKWTEFLERRSADLSLDIARVRCRINAFHTVRGVAVAIRLLRAAVGDLRSCNLHPDLRRLIEARSGLVIVSGPTGSGKSTTLAALLQELNFAHARNIVSLESPIEYLFANDRSFIRQREIPLHAPSFEQGILDALRENPDVLVISEMRTPEVMRLTLNAAETGHLVMATLHSATCAEALARIAMSFPAEIQSSILAQLADCLVGVICQRLDFLDEFQLRVPRCEVLTSSSASKGVIRGGQFSQLANVIQAGGDSGMWTFDRYHRWQRDKRDWVAATISYPTQPKPAVARTIREPIDISIEDEGLDMHELAKKL
jgi:twitching motility protein PilT